MDNKGINNNINVNNPKKNQSFSYRHSITLSSNKLDKAPSSKKQFPKLPTTEMNYFPKKNFDDLDRETQMKILSSEKKILQLGIKDFIIRSRQSGEIDPIPVKKMEGHRESVQSISSDKSKNSRKTEKFRKNGHPSLNSIGLIKSKTNHSVFSVEKDADIYRKNTLFSPRKKIKKKNPISNLLLYRSKSFSEDSQILLSPIKKPKQNLYLSPIKKTRSRISIKLPSPQKLRPDSDGLLLKMHHEEKIELKKTLNLGSLSSLDEGVSSEKPIIRELIKMKQVYDSMSDEEVESEEELKFLIYPKSLFKYFWDFIIFGFCLYSIIICPLSIAFDINDKLALFIDGLFIIDLILNFWMGYYDNEENLIVTPKKIVFNYIFGWFWVDLISSIPFNSLKYFDQLAQNVYFFCLFRILKNYKVFNSTNVFYMKILKNIFCYNGQVKSFFRNKIIIPNGLKKLFSNFIKFIVIIHTLSCFWIYLSTLSPGNNWVFNLKDSAKYDKGQLYLSSVYFNMVSVLTLGYGDILPVSFIERCYSLFLLIVSLGINTYAVSFLENLADLGNQKNAKLENKKDFLENISINYKVNYELYEKILNFLKYTYQFEADEKEKFIDYLPTSLKNLLICNMYKDIINNFTFFKLHKDDNIEFKCRILLALRPIITYKGEEVIKINQFVDEIIFVKSGQLSMFINYKKIHVRLLFLRKYENFGEILIVTNERSPVGLKVISGVTTELLLLRKEDFFSILNDFTENFNKILFRSSENLKRIKLVIKKKKLQIRRMITQTKLFKQASKVLNANNTLEQITKEGLVKYKSNPSNKKITFNLNQSPIKAQRRVSSTKIDNQLNITLNMNISNDANNSQNVFINLNSTNGNAFKKLKEIKVTINNESKGGRRLSMKPQAPTNNLKIDKISEVTEEQKVASDCSSKPMAKGGKGELINSFDNTADGSFLIDNEVNKVKKASINIFETIKRKIDMKTEEIKMRNRLNWIAKRYLDYESEKDANSNEEEDGNNEKDVLDNNYIRKYDQMRNN